MRFLRDYMTLVCMTNSRVVYVREMSREMVRRYGWRVQPLTRYVIDGPRSAQGSLPHYRTVRRSWGECFEIPLDSVRCGEVWLHFNDCGHSSHVIRWKDQTGIIPSDGSKQGADLEAWVERNR